MCESTKLAENRGNINMQNTERYFSYLKPCPFVLLLFILLSGCVIGSSGPSGRLQGDLGVLKSFNTPTILPDHTYYIQGVKADPKAIIAIKNNYQLRSRLWKRVDWSAKDLEKAVFWLQNSENELCMTSAGYLLLPTGEQLGIWYSQREMAIIKQPEANVVEVYPFKYVPGSSCQEQDWADDR